MRRAVNSRGGSRTAGVSSSARHRLPHLGHGATSSNFSSSQQFHHSQAPPSQSNNLSGSSSSSQDRFERFGIDVKGSPIDSQSYLDVAHNRNGNDNNSLYGIQVGVAQKQGRRPYQEDEFMVKVGIGGNEIKSTGQGNISDSTHLFGLFDGHAGGRCSKYVAANIAEALSDDPYFLTSIPHAIKSAFHSLNESFLKIAEKNKLHDGSTGIVVLIRGKQIFIGNVGDCRAVVLCAGKVVQLSKDQKPTSIDEQKRIVSLGGSVVYCMGVARVNGVLAVSRAFGNRTLRSVIRPDAEITSRDISKNDDFIVIGSDGLWDVLRNEDICEIVYSFSGSKQPPQVIAEELVNTALSRGSSDNVTCLVIRIGGYVNKIFNSTSGSSLGYTATNSNTYPSGHESNIITDRVERVMASKKSAESSISAVNSRYHEMKESVQKTAQAPGLVKNNYDTRKSNNNFIYGKDTNNSTYEALKKSFDFRSVSGDDDPLDNDVSYTGGSAVNSTMHQFGSSRSSMGSNGVSPINFIGGPPLKPSPTLSPIVAGHKQHIRPVTVMASGGGMQSFGTDESSSRQLLSPITILGRMGLGK